MIRRLLQSDDPRYLAVADIRTAVYGHADLWFGYVAIRRLPWPGDKAALRALEAQDPDYLALFRQFIAEAAGAVLVTNDAHLLDHRYALRAPVLPPRVFWETWLRGADVGDGERGAPLWRAHDDD